MKPAKVPKRKVPQSFHSGSWKAVVDAFLAASVDSNNTRQAYRRHLWRAGEVFRVRTVSEIDGVMLAGYRARLMADGRGDASHAQAVAALRSFLRWSRALGAHALSSEVIEATLKMPRARIRRPYRTIGEKDGRRLLAAAKTQRDRAIVGLLLGAGLRVAEVAALDARDLIDMEEGPVVYVRRGKGRRDRTVPIGEDVERLLRRHRDETSRYRCGNGPLFLAQDRGVGSRGAGRISARSIGIMLAHLVERVGVSSQGVSPHALRHTFAVRALQRGGSIVAVSKLLGHASIATTQRYVEHLRTGDLRTALAPLV